MSIPPAPFSRGRSGPTGFPSPRCLPCPPAPARHLMMPCYTFGHASSFFHVPNPDDVRGLCVLHVFAVATGAKSPLLPTSFDSRVQIRPFRPRHPFYFIVTCANRAFWPPSLKVNPSDGIPRLYCPENSLPMIQIARPVKCCITDV